MHNVIVQIPIFTMVKIAASLFIIVGTRNAQEFSSLTLEQDNHTRRFTSLLSLKFPMFHIYSRAWRSYTRTTQSIIPSKCPIFHQRSTYNRESTKFIYELVYVGNYYAYSMCRYLHSFDQGTLHSYMMGMCNVLKHDHRF